MEANLRNVTLRGVEPYKPWVSYADFLELPLHSRVKYVRTNLGLSQDELAQRVGASSGRQAVIRWEKTQEEKGSEPRDFAEAIARLTPYPTEAFRRLEADGGSLATVDLRLRALEAELHEAVDLIREALELLRAAPPQASGVDQRRRKAN